MASRSGKLRSPVLQLRVASSKLIRADEFGARIENMYPTALGTLRAIRGPCPYVPSRLTSGTPASSDAFVEPGRNVVPRQDITYGPCFGIFHAMLQEGQRDVLLLHTKDELWVFRGWARMGAGGGGVPERGNWERLLGPNAPLPVALDSVNRAQFPTQFVATPTGVVIIPQNRRAFFYDGEVILPLGYDRAPSPPSAYGPENSDEKLAPNSSPRSGVNDTRYARDGLPGRPSGMHRVFKYGRLGTVVHPTNYATAYNSDSDNEGDTSAVIMSWLEPGAWRSRVQWIDRWGNVSPLSEPSETISVERQPATGYDGSSPHYSYYVHGAMVRKQIAWTGIPPGPPGTIGRILCRTRDLKQSGDPNYYEVPLNARATSNPYATLPDNLTTLYPDNIPDDWLFKKPLEVDPVPEFKVAALAFGRLWIGNVAGDPGLIRPSAVGRWGTFPVNQEMYPDPSAAAVTGLVAVERGLLVFTETSTYLVEVNNRGDGFRSSPISARIGCVAPSSIATMDDGTVVWLGRDGFYAYSQGQVGYIFEDMRDEVRSFVSGRLCQAVAVYDDKSREYRCWVAVDGSTVNNLCYCFDGAGWRRRTDFAASGACVTRDHRGYVLMCGQDPVGRYGVFVQDVENLGRYTPRELDSDGVTEIPRTYTVETGWLSSMNSQERTTTTQVTLWLRETLVVEDSATGGKGVGLGSEDASEELIRVDVFRDWRDAVVHTEVVRPYPADDIPATWGATLDQGDKWARRRPYWTRVHIDVRAAEVFKLRIRSQHPWEFIGLQFDQVPRDSGGARLP